jgi:hypothetical protein
MIGHQSKFRSLFKGVAMILTATLLMSGVAVAAEKEGPPQTTTEGLNLVTSTKHRLVYLADDVDFSVYDKVIIVDSAVAFAKNWQRDYNRNQRDLSRKVQDKDVTRIKEQLAAEFKKVFTQTMTDSGIEVVSEPVAGALILRPAIINLEVNAPDLKSSSRSRTYTANAGSMTLYLEIYDSVSGALLANVMDAQSADRTSPSMSYASSTSNIMSADRMLKRWATEIASHFGVAKEADLIEEASDDASE